MCQYFHNLHLLKKNMFENVWPVGGKKERKERRKEGRERGREGGREGGEAS
jgi:hypothetical protein